MLTKFSQCYDRNREILVGAAEWEKDLIVIEAPTQARIIKCRGSGEDVEWLVEVGISDRPGDVAFQWLKPKHI